MEEDAGAPARPPHKAGTIRGAVWLILAAVAAPLMFRHWFFSSVVATSPTDEILIAITTVAGVLWSGALIAFQVQGLLTKVSASLSLLSVAFLMPILVMITPGPGMRIIALLYGWFELRETTGLGIGLLILLVIAFLIKQRWAPFSKAEKYTKLFDSIIDELQAGSIASGLLFLVSAAVYFYPGRNVVAWSSMVCIVTGLVYVTQVLRPEYAHRLTEMQKEAEVLKNESRPPEVPSLNKQNP